MDIAAFVVGGGGLFDELLVMPQQGVYEAVKWLIVEGMALLGFHPYAPMCICTCEHVCVCLCVLLLPPSIPFHPILLIKYISS